MLKITTATTALAATVATSAALGISAPISSAEDAATSTLGSQAKLVYGDTVQGWTISDLKPATDAIPYPVRGTLWEATATDEALQGSVTPIVSNLNARAPSGQTYRALFHVATPQGVNPATLAQGQKTSGKVYFDVTGDKPDSVVYNAGGQDLLTWMAPPPSIPQTQTHSIPYPSGSQSNSAPAVSAPAPAESAPAPAPAGTPPAPAESAPTPAPASTSPTPAPMGAEATRPPAGDQQAPLPAESQGTPLPPASQGTPLPPASQGTPLPAGNQGTPLPAESQGTPLPPSNQGTPLPAGSQGTPLPPGSQSATLPANSQSTPAPATTPVPPTTTAVAAP